MAEEEGVELSESLIAVEVVTSKDENRRVGFMELTLLLYMLSCGGPFGIEPAIGAAGPILTFAALLVVSVLWVAPQALVAAELSLMMQSNGGLLLSISFFVCFFSYVV
jgi:hypothetical protein